MTSNGIEILINRLEMQPELKRIFDSDEESFARFVNSINNILNNYNGNSPKIKKSIDIGFQTEPCNLVHPRSFKPLSESEYVPVIINVLSEVDNFSLAVEYFKSYYGLDCEQQSLKEISRRTGHHPRTVYNRTRFVLEVLKQYHKKQIWYDTLVESAVSEG